MKWSRFENTVMKLSSIPAVRIGSERDIAPIMATLLNAFGSERSIYGGGWGEGVSAESYRASYEHVRGFLHRWSPDSQASVLGGNATKLFGFA